MKILNYDLFNRKKNHKIESISAEALFPRQSFFYQPLSCKDYKANEDRRLAYFFNIMQFSQIFII